MSAALLRVVRGYLDPPFWETEIDTLHHQMTEAASDFERLAALDKDLRAAQARKEELEEAWLTAAD